MRESLWTKRGTKKFCSLIFTFFVVFFSSLHSAAVARRRAPAVAVNSCRDLFVAPTFPAVRQSASANRDFSAISSISAQLATNVSTAIPNRTRVNHPANVCIHPDSGCGFACPFGQRCALRQQTPCFQASCPMTFACVRNFGSGPFNNGPGPFNNRPGPFNNRPGPFNNGPGDTFQNAARGS